MGVFKLKFSMNFLMNMMHHLGIASILAIGGYYVATGETQIGTVVAFVSGLSQINDPWGDLVNWFPELSVTRTKYDLISRAVTGPHTAQTEVPPRSGFAGSARFQSTSDGP